MGLERYDKNSQTYGSVPERPKGAGCKPAGIVYVGSNPSRPTTKRPIAQAVGRFCFLAQRSWRETKTRINRSSIDERQPRMVCGPWWTW